MTRFCVLYRIKLLSLTALWALEYLEVVVCRHVSVQSRFTACAVCTMWTLHRLGSTTAFFYNNRPTGQRQHTGQPIDIDFCWLAKAHRITTKIITIVTYEYDIIIVYICVLMKKTCYKKYKRCITITNTKGQVIVSTKHVN